MVIPPVKAGVLAKRIDIIGSTFYTEEGQNKHNFAAVAYTQMFAWCAKRRIPEK
jgi:hypothetical protein